MLIYWIFWSVKFYLMLLFFRVALFFTLDYSWIQFRFLIFYMCYDRCSNNGYKRFLFKNGLYIFQVRMKSINVLSSVAVPLYMRPFSNIIMFI